MPSRRWLMRLAFPTAAALGAGTAIAIAAIPSADGTIHACYAPNATPPGALRIIDADATPPQTCLPDEQTITWNQRGPAGPVGPQGPSGPPGFSGGGTTTDDTTSTQRDTFPTPSQAGGPSADIFLKLDG